MNGVDVSVPWAHGADGSRGTHLACVMKKEAGQRGSSLTAARSWLSR